MRRYSKTIYIILLLVLYINLQDYYIFSNIKPYIEYVIVEKPPEIAPDPDPIPYTDDDLDLLARLIWSEAGSRWLSDAHQLMVGSVVLNRMDSKRFPNTIREVIYQPGQYHPENVERATPDERTIENARKLLEGGRILPENVVFQANFRQGDGTYCVVYDTKLRPTYFCYLEVI